MLVAIDLTSIPYGACNTANYLANRTSAVAYIVLHYTANNGDTAKNNIDYFARESVSASAHYFVDETEIWQSVQDTAVAWHCGGGNGPCWNANSIGIEMCSDMVNGTMTITEATVENAVALTKMLMEKYGVPVENVIRHYDVTGKICPLPWVRDESLWLDFKARLTEQTEPNEEEEEMVKYETIEEVPSYYRDAVQMAIDKGAIQGDGDGLDVSEDLAKTLTILNRLGVI